ANGETEHDAIWAAMSAVTINTSVPLPKPKAVVAKEDSSCSENGSSTSESEPGEAWTLQDRHEQEDEDSVSSRV
ncbi:unnamed protein product, partial [Polarella glacialis]